MAVKIKGVDVSQHNYIVDFAKVKAAGFDFAIIRCGYRGYGAAGTLVTDQLWLKNVQNAIDNNMPYGVYFLTQAKTEAEAVQEAQYVLNLVKAQAVQPLYPIYVDTEWSNNNHNGRADYLSKVQRTACVKAFCQEIERQGYYAGIYASKSWFAEHLIESELTKFDKWVAQYAIMCTYKGSYGMWQYGGGTNYLRNKKVDGVSSAACDQSYCYYDYPAIIRNNNLNGYTKVEPVPTYKITTEPMTNGDKIAICAKLDELKIGYDVTEIK